MMVLIPLISGHVFKRRGFAQLRRKVCLNPFDIRACVQTDAGCYASIVGVLIPLISGHVFKHHPLRGPVQRPVLIPLISGHVFKHLSGGRIDAQFWS